LDPGLIARAVALVLFLALAMLSAAAESTLFHINRARLRSLGEQGQRRADAVLRALEQPGSSFSTIAALHTLSLIVAAALATLVALDLTPPGRAVEPLGIVLALLALLLLAVAARTVAVARPEATALRLYRPMWAVGWLMAPLVLSIRGLERLLRRVLRAPRPNEPHSPEQELRLLVEGGEESGVIEEDEREMIHGIFELGEVTAREIMVPRIDVVCLSESAAVDEALESIVATGHSRLPIYEGTIDNITGVVYAKDILKHLRAGSLQDPVRPLARPAYFVPEAKKLDELLEELQQRRVHIAIVVDEYGGTAGLITIEDLLEEIVGEIRDEYDLAEEAHWEQISAHEVIFDARTSIRDVNEVLSVHLPDDEFDTLGGLVFDRLGKLPAKDDQVRVDGCLVQVLSTEGRRIRKVRVLVGPEDAEQSGVNGLPEPGEPAGR
jgi:putative hemolysin